MKEIIAIYRKEINGYGNGAMLFQDIRGKIDNSGAGNRSWGNALGLSLKQFGKRTIDSNAAADISRCDRTIGVIVGLE